VTGTRSGQNTAAEVRIGGLGKKTIGLIGINRFRQIIG
jgi:hypothetical protein